MALNEYILGFDSYSGGIAGVVVLQEDTGGVYGNTFNIPLTTGNNDTPASIIASVNSTISSFVNTNYGVNPSSISWLGAPATGMKTYNYPSLAVNTARQPSASYDTEVSISVPITATLSLTTGQTGTVTLQYADDSGFTTNVVNVQSSVNGNTGTLTIGLGLSQQMSATLTGVIPAGKYYRYTETSNTGSPTFGTAVIQEVVGV